MAGHRLSAETLGRKDVTASELDAMRNRICRVFAAVQEPSGSGYETSYVASGTDFTTNFRAVGVKSPEQLEDEFLTLFVWMWSLKDYLKALYEAKGLNGSLVEEEVNSCPALTYVADIANRAKHGDLRASRSGQFAELVDVGFDAPLGAIERLSFAGPDVELHIKDPQLVKLHATVATRAGACLDALLVLREAMNCWENKVLVRVAA